MLGPGVNKAELKVIGFREGKMPSLVATQTFILKEGVPVVPLSGAARVERPDFVPFEQKEDDGFLLPGVNQGTSSVTSSPGDLGGMDGFDVGF